MSLRKKALTASGEARSVIKEEEGNAIEMEEEMSVTQEEENNVNEEEGRGVISIGFKYIKYISGGRSVIQGERGVVSEEWR